MLLTIGVGAYLTHHKTALSPLATPPACDSSRVASSLKRLYARFMRRHNVRRSDVHVSNAATITSIDRGYRCSADVVIGGDIDYRAGITYRVTWSDRLARRYRVRIVAVRPQR